MEKRRSRRETVNIKLEISDLYHNKETGIHDIEAPIEIVDVSSHGIGFISECIFPENYYFNATIHDEETTLLKKELKIVRSRAIDHTHFKYGSEFKQTASEKDTILL